MTKVKLDLTKLLGFSIVAQEGDQGAGSDKLGAKIGDKGQPPQDTRSTRPNQD